MGKIKLYYNNVHLNTWQYKPPPKGFFSYTLNTEMEILYLCFGVALIFKFPVPSYNIITCTSYK